MHRLQTVLTELWDDYLELQHELASTVVIVNPPRKGSTMSGDHKVKQDSDYVSRVDPSVVESFLQEFGKPPTPSKAAYKATIAHRQPVTIGQDMPLAPATYGFADKNAVDNWLEQALDSPT